MFQIQNVQAFGKYFVLRNYLSNISRIDDLIKVTRIIQSKFEQNKHVFITFVIL